MTERKPPVFVLLDLDDTILDFHQAEANAVSKTLAQLGIEPKESTIRRYSQINAGRWELLEQGLVKPEDTARCPPAFFAYGMTGRPQRKKPCSRKVSASRFSSLAAVASRIASAARSG